MSEKRGRPKTGRTRNKVYKLRMDDEEKEMLEYLSYKMDAPKSTVLRRGIKMMYDAAILGVEF